MGGRSRFAGLVIGPVRVVVLLIAVVDAVAKRTVQVHPFAGDHLGGEQLLDDRAELRFAVDWLIDLESFVLNAVLQEIDDRRMFRRQACTSWRCPRRRDFVHHGIVVVAAAPADFIGLVGKRTISRVVAVVVLTG